MEKVMIGKVPAAMCPTVIAGAMVNGKPNYNTLGCFGLITPQPPTVYIKSIKPHYTNLGIRETGYYSVNFPSPALVRKTDYLGLVSGKDVDKSTVFKSFFGSVDKAPMIEECPVNMLCKVIQTVEIPSQPLCEIFIGEIEETYVNQDCIANGKPDMAKLWPLVMHGLQYWEITGRPVGTPWSEGKALIKNEVIAK
ncbi:MAG TPA: flavin reductase family protein [Methanocella sp.]|nr:flavin reductase family protein [Methanocella sp.]